MICCKVNVAICEAYRHNILWYHTICYFAIDTKSISDICTLRSTYAFAVCAVYTKAITRTTSQFFYRATWNGIYSRLCRLRMVRRSDFLPPVWCSQLFSISTAGWWYHCLLTNGRRVPICLYAFSIVGSVVEFHAITCASSYSVVYLSPAS